MVWGGNPKDVEHAGDRHGGFAEGFTNGTFSFKLAILVKFEFLYDDSSRQICRDLECPCCSDFESRQSRDQNYWFSCNTVDCITFCLLDFVVLKVGIAF